MNDEYLILTPINIESIRDTEFKYHTINLVPEDLLTGELKNAKHYLSNISECNPTLIEDTYLSLLSRITQSLNSLHSTDLTEKQWETVLGYWLINVVSSLSERWQNLERIERLGSSTTVCLGSYNSSISPKFDTMEGKNFSENHEFNAFVYQQLLRYFPEIKWKLFPVPNGGQTGRPQLAPNNLHTQKSLKNRVKQILRYPILIFFRNLRFKPEIFIVASWVPRINFVWISLLTRKLILSSENQFSKITGSATELETSSWLFARDLDPSFTKACTEIINIIAPSSLTGDFRNILSAIEIAGLGYYPKYVISNQHHCTGSDPQRIWFGVFGNRDNQLNIMQHGGTYGCYKFHWSAYVEMRISRVFMSWGWSALDQSEKPNLDVPALRLIPKRKNTRACTRSDTRILFLLCPEPGYNSLFLPSQPYGPNEYLRYLYGILKLMNSLDARTALGLFIRRQNHRNFLTSAFFSTFHPQIREDEGPQLYFEDWDLIVSTYNGTNSLECLLSGKPCVFYWDNNYAAFTEFSAPLFKHLEEVGVLHFSAESAKVILEMDSVERKSWWSSSDVTDAVTNFLKFFGKTSGGNLGFSKILAKDFNSIDPNLDSLHE